MKVKIEINDSSRKKIANALSKVLADSYTLYLKTQNFHWNVTGSHFLSLHTLFESQYTELANAVDILAERIRTLGHTVSASYSQFMKLTTIKEETSVPSAMKMVEYLVKVHGIVFNTLREAHTVAEEAKDEVTVGLLIDRMTVHEKTLWMLRSILEK